MKTNRLPNIHPGEILLRDFLEPMGITRCRLAKADWHPAGAGLAHLRGAAGDHCRDSSATGRILWRGSAQLAEPAANLRFGGVRAHPRDEGAQDCGEVGRVKTHSSERPFDADGVLFMNPRVPTRQN